LPRHFRPQNSGRATPLGATSDGRAIFQHGFGDDAELWSFDAEPDRWQQLGVPPVRVDTACMSGDTLVVQTASYRNNGKVLADDPAQTTGSGSGYLGDGYVLPRVASRNLTGESPWLTGWPGAEIVFTSGHPKVICAGDSVFIHDGANVDVGLVYSLRAGTWTNPPPPPMRGYFGASVGAGPEIVFAAPTFNGGRSPTMGYTQASNSWRVLEGMPRVERGLHWNGNAVVAYVEALPRGPSAQAGRSGVFSYVPKPD
jgi:hypothetical protein